MKTKKTTRLLIITSVFSVIVLKVFFVIYVSAFGGNLSEYEQKIESLKRENTFLTRELARSSSLEHIETKVDDMKFIAPTDIIYIDTNQVLAKN